MSLGLLYTPPACKSYYTMDCGTFFGTNMAQPKPGHDAKHWETILDQVIDGYLKGANHAQRLEYISWQTRNVYETVITGDRAAWLVEFLVYLITKNMASHPGNLAAVLAALWNEGGDFARLILAALGTVHKDALVHAATGWIVYSEFIAYFTKTRRREIKTINNASGNHAPFIALLRTAFGASRSHQQGSSALLTGATQCVKNVNRKTTIGMSEKWTDLSDFGFEPKFFLEYKHWDRWIDCFAGLAKDDDFLHKEDALMAVRIMGRKGKVFNPVGMAQNALGMKSGPRYKKYP
ncbi:hypothetical protein F4777DRAFT_576367 [Nemania sp. FL0916]|nr:hypothetical protein F4777DRAFT_576367 [Nemania sp. FL0916]